MSNKLKTLSAKQLETFLSEKVGDYLGEDCTCKVTNLDTPHIDTEADIALSDKRSLSFEVEISYTESS